VGAADERAGAAPDHRHDHDGSDDHGDHQPDGIDHAERFADDVADEHHVVADEHHAGATRGTADIACVGGARTGALAGAAELTGAHVNHRYTGVP
jgi:hypothetical protein